MGAVVAGAPDTNNHAEAAGGSLAIKCYSSLGCSCVAAMCSELEAVGHYKKVKEDVPLCSPSLEGQALPAVCQLTGHARHSGRLRV